MELAPDAPRHHWASPAAMSPARVFVGAWRLEVGVEGLGLRVWGVGSRYRVQGSGCRVGDQALGLGV